MAEAPEAPCTPFTDPIPGGGGMGSTPPPKNLPALKDHLCAKFHPDPSSSLDFSREQTDTHIALYVLDVHKPFGPSLIMVWNDFVVAVQQVFFGTSKSKTIWILLLLD